MVTESEGSSFTLENMARMAAKLGPVECDRFFKGLSKAQREQLAPIATDLRKLLDLPIDNIGQLWTDPLNEAHSAFSNLINKTQSSSIALPLGRSLPSGEHSREEST